MGLTIAYLLSKDNWTWDEFAFPKVFLFSTVVILCSSFSFYQALKAIKSENSSRFRLFGGLGLICGTLFVLSQVIGWLELQSHGIFLGGNPDGSFLYIISGVHVIHVLVGLFLLAIMIIRISGYFKKPITQLLFVTDPDAVQKFKLAVLYWHFVDILWIYLLFFFLFNHL